MERCLACEYCKHSVYIPPSAQHINCIGCEIDCSVGSSCDNDFTHYRRTKDGGRWKKLLFSKEQQSQTGMYPRPRAISMTDHSRRGRRALLCGVSYKKHKYELKGTLQGVRNIRDLLVHGYNFPEESILILAEQEPYNPPTRKNIENAFKWLMRGIQPGDSLVFYFSGQGMRQRDFYGDEIDEFDETICPMDFERNGMITDDYINTTIVRPLTRHVTLHAIIDSCHSGSILDLPYVHDVTTGKWVDNIPPSGTYNHTNGGKAICFSACEDYQLAADTSALSMKKETNGVMTMAFINAVKASLARNEMMTYRDIMDSMHQSIKHAGKSGGFCTGISRILQPRNLQDLVLTSSEEFNTNTEFKL